MTYPYSDPKNLHDRIIEVKPDSVVFRNSDNVPEEQSILSKGPNWVVVLSNKDGFLRLWNTLVILGILAGIILWIF